jgi:hypothetical protein
MRRLFWGTKPKLEKCGLINYQRRRHFAAGVRRTDTAHLDPGDPERVIVANESLTDVTFCKSADEGFATPQSELFASSRMLTATTTPKLCFSLHRIPSLHQRQVAFVLKSRPDFFKAPTVQNLDGGNLVRRSQENDFIGGS